MRRFYDEFEKELPKILAVVPADSSLVNYERVQNYLESNNRDFWRALHDLPVIEIAVWDAFGIHEWWQGSPGRISRDRTDMVDVLADTAVRYEHILVFDDQEVVDADKIPATLMSDPDAMREKILSMLGYEESSLGNTNSQVGLSDFEQ